MVIVEVPISNDRFAEAIECLTGFDDTQELLLKQYYDLNRSTQMYYWLGDVVLKSKQELRELGNLCNFLAEGYREENIVIVWELPNVNI